MDPTQVSHVAILRLPFDNLFSKQVLSYLHFHLISINLGWNVCILPLTRCTCEAPEDMNSEAPNLAGAQIIAANSREEARQLHTVGPCKHTGTCHIFPADFPVSQSSVWLTFLARIRHLRLRILCA
jgi:hypothetical protein